MSTNINSTEQIVEINAGDQITNINVVSQSTTQVISGEQVVTIDTNAGTIPAAWGLISGTLSNQIDLQNALNAKQNNITLTTTGTSGAATLVGSTLNIPNYTDTGLTSVGLAMPTAFNVSGSPLTSNGTITVTGAGTGAQYIKGDGTLATFPTTIDQSLRLIREVYNKTGATLTKGTIVYINGGQGNLPTVTKAIATGDSTSAQTFGVVQSDITNNNNGYVVIAGGIDNLSTQSFDVGEALYLSPTTAGAWTTTKPYAPNHLVYIGTVVRSHPTQGVVEVRIANGYELDELHNVSARFPVNNDGLFYNSTSGVWENKSIESVIPTTFVPQTRLITINGNSQNLTADRTWNVGTVTSVAATGGTGISVVGSPITTSGSLQIINTAPDQVVSLTGTGTTSVTGTYPNFTINSADQFTGTVTSVAATAGTGISISGSPITSSGTLSITNTAPDQVVSLTPSGLVTVTGTYPNFTVGVSGGYDGTVKSVNAQVPTGFEVSGVPITTTGTIDIRFASGYSLPTNTKQSQWDTAYTKRLDSLTTDGNYGAATLINNVLNVPQYTLDGLNGEPAINLGTIYQYWRGDKTWQTLDTSSVPENGPVYFTEGRVRGTVLSGLNITGGSISSTDSVLNAFGKIQNQINGLIGGSIFQSTWNASTNTPTLTSSVGTKGYYYIVSVAGTTNLNGITDWQVGDWAIFDGTVWRKVDNTDAVVSVNGYTGVVNLVLDDMADVSAATPTNTQLLRYNGTSSKWENWTPTFEPALTKGNLTESTSSVLTISGGSNAVIGSGTSIEVKQSSASGSGYLSSTDWNTFNNKQATISLTTTGSSGAATFVSNTLNVPNYTLSGLGGVPSTRSLTINGTAYDLSADRTWSVGTVTSIGLTTGTTGTDVSISGSPVTGSGTITLNIPIASATNTGKLSSTDWSTFNNKQNALTLTTTGTSGAATLVGATLNIPQYQSVLTNPVTGTGTTNYVTKWSSTSGITNSQIYDDASKVYIGSTSGSERFNITTTDGFNLGLYSSDDYNAINFYSSAGSYRGAIWLRTSTSLMEHYVATGYGQTFYASNAVALTLNSSGTVRLNNYTTNGFVKFSSSNGTLVVDTTAYPSGSGTTNYIPKWTSSSALGDSAITDNGTTVTLVSRALSGTSATFSGNVFIGGSTLYNPTFAQRFIVLDAGTTGDNTSMMQLMGSRTVNGTYGAIEFMHQAQGNRLAIRAKRSGADNSVGMDILVTNAGSISTALDILPTGAASFSSSVNIGTAINTPGSAFGSNLNVNGANLGGTTGNTAKIANLGFDAGGNHVGLGITAYRQSTGTNWTTAGIKFTYDVDNTTALYDNMLCFYGGSVGIGNTSPSEKLDVYGNVLAGSTGDGQGYKIRGTDGTIFRFADTTATGGGVTNVNIGAVGTTSGDVRVHATNVLFLSNNGNTERMRITSGGNVGIGTTSPSAPLTVSGNISLGNRAVAGTSYIGKLREDNGGITNAYGIGFVNSDINGAGYINFYTTPVGGSGDTRMTITGAGSIGIGTASPTANINGSTNKILDITSSNFASLLFHGSTAQESSIAGGTNGLYIDVAGHATASNNVIVFRTGDTNSSYSVSERMRITSGGELYLGVTSLPTGATGVGAGSMYISNNLYLGNTNGTANYAVRFDTYADKLYAIWANASGTDQGGVYLSYGGTSWTANSDIRLKNIINPISNAISKLLSLNPVIYSWKSDDTNKENLGLIAQDVEKVFPQLIDINKDGMLGVRYTELVPVLVKAIQELKAELDTLKNK